MDILTHTLSGIAIGTIVTSFSNKSLLNKIGVTAFAGFGAMLPDFDAISLWSKFDSTFGKLFGLEHSGKVIYFEKFWYSHHGFLHSILASILIMTVFVFILNLTKSKKSKVTLIQLIKNKKLYLIGFILGFVIHLLQDMPTPYCVWGGVNFFWPSKSYLGGTGDIWWWNNYDIFLITLTVIVLNGLVHIFKNVIKAKISYLTTLIFLTGFTFSIVQIKTRNFDFNYVGHTPRYNEFENQSKEIQKRILGNRMYDFMEHFDNAIPINF